MTRRRLFLIVNDYNAELPFFETEVLKLRDIFDLVMISVNGKKEEKNYLCDSTFFFDFNIRKTVRYVYRFFFSPICHLEIKSILTAKDPIYVRIRRVISSVRVYSSAAWFRNSFLKLINSEYDGAIIYSFWCDFPILSFLEYKKMYSDCKYISRIHGYDLYDERAPFGRQSFRWFINTNIDRLVFIAENGMKYYLNRHKDIDPHRTALHRLGVMPVNTAKRSIGEDGFILVSCSSIIPLKRVDLIVRALSKYEGKFRIKWVHFGDGEDLSSLMKLVDELLYEKPNIECSFAGRVNNSVVRDYYANNDVGCFITTSSTEGAPVSVMEALSAGIPVVATGVGDIPNMIDENGVMLKSDPTAEEVIRAVESIIDSYFKHDTDDNYDQMCKCSQRIYNEYYRADINAEEFIDDVLLGA